MIIRNEDIKSNLTKVIQLKDKAIAFQSIIFFISKLVLLCMNYFFSFFIARITFSRILVDRITFTCILTFMIVNNTTSSVLKVIQRFQK